MDEEEIIITEEDSQIEDLLEAKMEAKEADPSPKIVITVRMAARTMLRLSLYHITVASS